MKVLIYSANRLFGECLEHGLSRVAEVEWAACAPDLPSAVEAALAHSGLDILVDLNTADTAKVVRGLRAAAPRACILALAVDGGDCDSIVACARLGFQGFVPRDAPLDAVPRIIRDARQGEVVLEPKAAAGLMQALHATPAASPAAPPENLTRKEREVCLLVCEGLTNKEIAREMNRSIGTVKNHIHAILGKLDVPRRGAIPSRFVRGTPAMAAHSRP